MSPSSSHFPSRKKPWVATGITVISAMPYLFRARSRFACDDSSLDSRKWIIKLREEHIVNGKGLRCQVSGLRNEIEALLVFLRPDTCDLRPVFICRPAV